MLHAIEALKNSFDDNYQPSLSLYIFREWPLPAVLSSCAWPVYYLVDPRLPRCHRLVDWHCYWLVLRLTLPSGGTTRWASRSLESRTYINIKCWYRLIKKNTCSDRKTGLGHAGVTIQVRSTAADAHTDCAGKRWLRLSRLPSVVLTREM